VKTVGVRAPLWPAVWRREGGECAAARTPVFGKPVNSGCEHLRVVGSGCRIGMRVEPEPVPSQIVHQANHNVRLQW
jgi:hypothetical protein